MSPEGFDVDKARSLDEQYFDAPSDVAWPGCTGCIGLSLQTVIDHVYKQLRAIPTDALMRELARRFL
jgi:hypothetical protein